MPRKAIYRHSQDKHSLPAAELDRQFAAVERTLVTTAEDAAEQPLGVRVPRLRAA
ncbi:hypothetical protein [Streptomyces sp. NPDC058385]|uniref:hypothetical protein n=1 Tax=Streptomyces sp. NPDC058385 TaxID=3346473 RepID=UPI00364AD753